MGDRKVTQKYKIPMSLRLRLWASENFHLVVYLSLASVIFSGLVFLVAFFIKNSQLKALTKAVENLSYRVVVVSPDGRVAEVRKALVNSDILRSACKAILENYLTLDILWFTNGSTDFYQSYPKELNKETVKEIKKLQLAVRDIIDEKAFASFRSIVNYAHQMGLQLKLPLSVKILNCEDRVLSDNKANSMMDKQYFYQAECRVLATGFKQGTLTTGESSVKVEWQFYLDPIRGSELNPLGIKIISLKYSWVIMDQVK